jgi:hypothetical protein
MKNKRTEAVKEALRQPYTWPGAYPKTFVVEDGCLCQYCIRENFRDVVRDTKSNRGPYNVIVDVLWEGEVFCADCSRQLETAYGD